MSVRGVVIVLLSIVCLGAAEAGEVDGSIIVKHKLTPRKVTAPVSAYQRGVSVELGSAGTPDPLAYERMHVVIYLEGKLPSKAVSASMAQEGREFVPDTLVVPVGSAVSFPNLDPIFHNVFSLSKAKTFDLGNYPKNQTRVVTFTKTGVVLVNCYLHPNMAAAIVVTPNQWCTRANQAGEFALHDIPGGSYEIVAWHKSSGFFRQTVNVDAHGTTHIAFLIPLDENGVMRAAAQK